MKHLFTQRSLIALAVVCLPSVSFADSKIYGKVHVSADVVDVGDGQHAAISSNSSRIGFKGKENIQGGMNVFWKLESDIDVSGERSELKSRNRYVGIETEMGNLSIGYQDSPFKKVGGLVGLWADTIGDRRAILGSGNGKNKFNIRTKSGATFHSKNYRGIKVSATLSAGGVRNDDGSDANPIASVGVVYKPSGTSLLVAAASERHNNFNNGNSAATAVRGVVGYQISDIQIRAIYEDINAAGASSFDRSAYGGSISVPVSSFRIKAQLFTAEESVDSEDSGAMSFAAGGDYKATKNTSIYAVYTQTNNDENAKFNIAGSGHGNSFKTTESGFNSSGVSVGLSHKF